MTWCSSSSNFRRSADNKTRDSMLLFRYHLDGSIINLRRLRAHTKTQVRLIQDLLFTDSSALVAHTERARQRITSCFADASRLFGPEVILKMTEVLYQPAPHGEYRPPHVNIGDTELKTTQQFTYLSCTISSDANKIDKEIDGRFATLGQQLLRQTVRVWNNKSLKSETKIRAYRAIVLTTLLYGSETWVTYRSHIHLLERFHQRCLRTILNFTGEPSSPTSKSQSTESEVSSIEVMILKYQLQWAGHVSRIKDHRFPKIVMYGELYLHRAIVREGLQSISRSLCTLRVVSQLIHKGRSQKIGFSKIINNGDL